MSTTKGDILVWDLPVRVGHWLMAGAFVIAWLTGESEEWRLVHVVAGGTVVGVVLFRLFWGLFGTKYALFADFARSPAAAWTYLKSLLGPKPQHYVGHNPAGGWAIVLLLALALLGGATGWLGYEDIGGEWLKELHEGAANAMLVVVLVHLGGVLVGSVTHRENLPRTMVTGRKRGNAIDAIIGAKPFAAFALLVWTAVVAWLLSR
jgi:cytochrome b